MTLKELQIGKRVCRVKCIHESGRPFLRDTFEALLYAGNKLLLFIE